jgi:hypothetical protein
MCQIDVMLRKRLTLRIRPEMDDTLSDLAREEELTKNDIIVRIIRERLRQPKKEEPSKSQELAAA